jgi:hypothetical protein
MTDTTERPPPWWEPPNGKQLADMIIQLTPEPSPLELTCPCPRVGRNCAGCILPPMGARPPITHPLGWVIASVAGPIWRFRGWLYGLTHGDN